MSGSQVPFDQVAFDQVAFDQVAFDQQGTVLCQSLYWTVSLITRMPYDFRRPDTNISSKRSRKPSIMEAPTQLIEGML
jgi:hypothetical protein